MTSLTVAGSMPDASSRQDPDDAGTAGDGERADVASPGADAQVHGAPGPVAPGLAVARCAHCREALPVASGEREPSRFCCAGCAAAHATIRGLGLDGYYRRRALDPSQRSLKPDDQSFALDYASYAHDEGEGIRSLSLMVEGLHCAACVWLIESVLARMPGVMVARVNMTTRRLALTWLAERTDADTLATSINALGYRLVPYDPAAIERAGERRERELLKALAVAGFAAGNVMLLSIAIWAGHEQGMGPATRSLLHWVSALIALPAIAYAGRPFIRSAASALRAARLNMDVPISLAVVLAAGMSLHQTVIGADHAYFDSAVALLFFLLVGRYLDHRARGKARSAAEQLMTLNAKAVTVIEPGGARRVMPPSRVEPGMKAFVVAGERIGVDGVVRDGRSEVDTSLINGETVPLAAAAGSRVFAGTLNLSGALTVEVTGVGEGTLLAEIARLMEAAEQGRGRFVALADRVARLYAPVVHGLALLTFAGWLAAGVGWQAALLNAIAVLIITCPCALALAVPAVQVVASARLSRRGILLKSSTALERLAAVDTVVFDKTGTLTQGRPELVSSGDTPDLATAAGLAAASKHPLARALARAAERDLGAVHPSPDVREVAGQGLEGVTADGPVRLGNRAFCGIGEDSPDAGAGLELWFRKPGGPAQRFVFADRPRDDAAAVVADLRHRGLSVSLLSGDRASAVAAVAAETGIEDWRAACDPAEKTRVLAAMSEAGRRVLMVGDGLNDAPALAAAHVSLSPSTAVDLTRTSADLVFQGRRLGPVTEALHVARRAYALTKGNFALAFLYNAVTVPLAVAGLVSPLIAAIAMSASSLAVISNAMRLNRDRSSWTFSSS